MAHSRRRSQSRGRSQSHAVTGVAIAFLILAWIAVSLRLWVRGRMIRSLGWDDYTMFAATVLFTVFCVALINFSELDEANKAAHFDTVKQARPAVRWVLTWEGFYIATITVSKISLSIFFMRLIVKKWQKVYIWAVLIISTVWGTVSLFFTIFHCGDPRDYLEKLLAERCASPEAQLAMVYAYTAMTCATDWSLAAIPIFLAYGAKLDLRAKISVCFILSLGFVGSIASVVRFGYIDGLLDLDDFFWRASDIAVWSCIEPGMCIIASSLATLRSLFKECFNQIRDISNHASNPLPSERGSQTLKNSKQSSVSGSSAQRHSFRCWKHKRNSATITTCTGGQDVEMKSVLGTSQERGRTRNLSIMDEERDEPWALPTNESEVGIARVVELEVRVQDRCDISDTAIDRRSSHTLGDEERENMRLSMQSPRRPQSEGEV